MARSAKQSAQSLFSEEDFLRGILPVLILSLIDKLSIPNTTISAAGVRKATQFQVSQYLASSKSKTVFNVPVTNFYNIISALQKNEATNEKLIDANNHITELGRERLKEWSGSLVRFVNDLDSGRMW